MKHCFRSVSAYFYSNVGYAKVENNAVNQLQLSQLFQTEIVQLAQVENLENASKIRGA
jgi:hypothetical protein